MELLSPGLGVLIWQVLMVLIIMSPIAFAIYTIYNIVTKSDAYHKAVWILIVLFFPIIGSLIYWFDFNRAKRKRVFEPFGQKG